MSHDESTDPQAAPGRDANGRFGPGNPGRPHGARQRFTRRAFERMLNHFDAHGDGAMDFLGKYRQHDYVRSMASLFPRVIEAPLPAFSSRLSEAEAQVFACAAYDALQNAEDYCGALRRLETVLAGEDPGVIDALAALDATTAATAAETPAGSP